MWARRSNCALILPASCRSVYSHRDGDVAFKLEHKVHWGKLSFEFVYSVGLLLILFFTIRIFFLRLIKFFYCQKQHNWLLCVMHSLSILYVYWHQCHFYFPFLFFGWNWNLWQKPWIRTWNVTSYSECRLNISWMLTFNKSRFVGTLMIYQFLWHTLQHVYNTRCNHAIMWKPREFHNFVWPLHKWHKKEAKGRAKKQKMRKTRQ